MYHKRLLEKAKNTFDFHYFRIKNDWTFPPSMAHTSGAKMAKGTYEAEVSDIIEQHLQDGSVFIDIGANVGYFTRMAARKVNSSGKVYAFEADYANYNALNNNTIGLDNIVTMNLAVSSENGFTEFHQSSHSSCHSLVETDNYLNGDQWVCPSITLDKFWSLYLDETYIDLVKIDVEGAELFVLEGMDRMIDRQKVGSVVLEYCPAFLRETGLSREKLVRLLLEHFSITIIEDEYRSLLGTSRIETAKEFEKITQKLLARDDAVNINLLCDARPAE